MWSAATVVVCALNLLGRSAASFPPIDFIAAPPPEVSAQVEAFVHPASRRIVLVTSSWAFRDAQQARYRCGESDALRKIASVIVHEEWHVLHGRDERAAYQAQLMALVQMGRGPGTALHHSVMRAMIEVTSTKGTKSAKDMKNSPAAETIQARK